MHDIFLGPEPELEPSKCFTTPRPWSRRYLGIIFSKDNVQFFNPINDGHQKVQLVAGGGALESYLKNYAA